MDKYFIELKALQPSCVFRCIQKIHADDKLSKKTIIWELTDEISPLDVYCYLYAKYDYPNGAQNFFREDSSDNLIHWEWSLANKDESGIVSIQGRNFSTDVMLIGDHHGEKDVTLNIFSQQIKSDFEKYGGSMRDVRNTLEKWTRFVNPYHRIRSVVDKNIRSLEVIDIKIGKDRGSIKLNEKNRLNLEENWKHISDKYDKVIGLTFGLRSMLPVLAETFINLIIFILAKSEIKASERRLKHIICQPIDIRVQSLDLNCNGFIKPIDSKDNRYKKFRTLMNERNDILHGNIEIKKLMINDIYFNGRVPVFSRCEDAWQVFMGASLNSVKYNTIFDDHSATKDFIDFILDHLNKETKNSVKFAMNHRELGYNFSEERTAVLLSNHRADYLLGPSKN